MNDTLRQKRIDRASIFVLFQVPFFAPGVSKLPVVFDDSVPTACTDGNRILWNRQWFDSLKDDVLPTVLCHEVAHCLLGHIWRFPGVDQSEFDTWNQATDHAINNMLVEFGQQRTAQNYADPFPMPDGQICCDPKFKDMAEEEIFALLSNSRPPGGGGKPQAGQGSGKGSKAGQGAGQGQKPGKSNPSANAGQANSAGHKPFGEFRPAAGDPQKQKEQKTDWQNTLFQSVTMAKQRGDVPGSVSRLVDEIVHPQIPWPELVRQWLREKADDDWSWLKPNPFFDESGFILPSLDSERMGRVVFAKDTSGSIDAHTLAQFHAEEQACLDDMKPAALLDLCCDARITQEKEYRLGDQIDKRCPGGGGTRFEPVFERLEELPDRPKLLVYLTDLYGSFPKEAPDFPVLWVVFGNAIPETPPFGEVVIVK